jgi:hypothetical protein
LVFVDRTKDGDLEEILVGTATDCLRAHGDQDILATAEVGP